MEYISKNELELALLEKSNIIHDHDDLYHRKDKIYTKEEITTLISNNNDKIKTMISENLKNINEEITNDNIISNENREKILSDTLDKLKQIENLIGDFNKKFIEINSKYDDILNNISKYSEDMSNLKISINRIEKIIPELVTLKEFNSNFEILERKVFSL